MTTLAINYKHGKGNVELNLDALMPCNDQDFRRVLSSWIYPMVAAKCMWKP